VRLNWLWSFENESIFKYLPGFKKSIYVFKNMKLQGFHERQNAYHKDLDQFYEKSKIKDLLNTKGWDGVPAFLDNHQDSFSKDHNQ
ncbi:MAG: hypothetical protein AAFQ94_13225, partial [Bacteroidota bacterium]